MAKVQLAEVQTDSKSHTFHPNALQGCLLFARRCNVSEKALLTSAEKSPWSSQRSVTHMLHIIPGLTHTLILPVGTYHRGERGLVQEHDYNSQQLVVSVLTLFSFGCNFRQEISLQILLPKPLSSSLVAHQPSGPTRPPRRDRAKHLHNTERCPRSAWQGRVLLAGNEPLPI